MATYLGLIVIDATGKPAMDDYGSVIVFPIKDDTLPYTTAGEKVYRLVKAHRTRKKRKPAAPPGGPITGVDRGGPHGMQEENR